MKTSTSPTAWRYSLRALAALMRYPSEDWRDVAPDLLDVIDSEGQVPSAAAKALRIAVTQLLTLNPLDVQSQYVETFDRGRSTCLNLFEHVHGDSRDRGPAMIDLQQTYAQAGLDMGHQELPDHLCVVLEFASTQPVAVAREFLGEMTHIVRAIFSALSERQSRYAAVLAALLSLMGERVELVAYPEDEALDESWAEPEAFGGCSTKGQNKPGQEQAIHFVRRQGAASSSSSSSSASVVGVAS